MRRIILGITGASGSVYSKSLLTYLSAMHPELEIHIVITETGEKVFEYELGYSFWSFLEKLTAKVIVHSNSDFFAPIASGSFKTEAMIIAPCSMTALAKIANGIGDTLLTRAADVCLKEHRRLIACVRETPYSQIHLANMLTLSKAGGDIFSLSPSFYNRPETIDDITAQTAERILFFSGIASEVKKEWGTV